MLLKKKEEENNLVVRSQMEDQTDDKTQSEAFDILFAPYIRRTVQEVRKKQSEKYQTMLDQSKRFKKV